MATDYNAMVEHYLENFSGDKEKARRALTGLFSILAALNSRAEMAKLAGNEEEMLWAASETQQLICWTPLRQFLRELCQSNSLWIRAAAKGELADQTGEFWGDPEVGLISSANLFTMWQSRKGRIYFGTARLAEILVPSQEAGLPIPGLQVTTLSTP